MSFLSGLIDTFSGNPLGALQGISSILGGASQARQGSGLVNQGNQWLNQAIGNADTSYKNALNLISQRQAQGAYNAQAALQAAAAQANHDLTLQDKNTAGQLATLGYKRGDSPFAQSAAHNSENANLALQQRQIDLQNAYDQKYNNDMLMANQYGNQLNNLLMNGAQYNIGRGTQLQNSAYSGLGAMIGAGGLNGIMGGQRQNSGTQVNPNKYSSPIGPDFGNPMMNTGYGYGAQYPDRSYMQFDQNGYPL